MVKERVLEVVREDLRRIKINQDFEKNIEDGLEKSYT